MKTVFGIGESVLVVHDFESKPLDVQAHILATHIKMRGQKPLGAHVAQEDGTWQRVSETEQALQHAYTRQVDPITLESAVKLNAGDITGAEAAATESANRRGAVKRRQAAASATIGNVRVNNVTRYNKEAVAQKEKDEKEHIREQEAKAAFDKENTYDYESK